MRKHVKNIIGNIFSSFDYPLILNSYGRSGSTVLTKSIINHASRSSLHFVKKSIGQSKWDLNKAEYINGVIYKSHDYPPRELKNDRLRMIYTFADPVDVVLSLVRLHKKDEEWMREHFHHLRAPYTNFTNILSEDQLGLEKHIDSWLQEKRFPIAFIRYETMWYYQKEISNFLGFELKLPPYKKRLASSNDSISIREKLQETYAPLNMKLSILDDFFVINKPLL